MTRFKIGFIGTGIMGKPMIANLLGADYSVTVFSRTKSKASDLIAKGATWVDSPAEVAANSDIVITCVTDTADVEAVLINGSEPVINSARKGLICIDMSTISPMATRQMNKILAAKGTTLLDAPVSGGQTGAVEGKLSIMVGGEKDVFETVLPVMQAMGKTITYCGPSGNGQITKLANQVMVVHTLMSMAEGLAFAEKAGLDLATTLNVTTAGAAASHSLKVLGTKAVAGDFAPAFMVDLQVKDLRLVTEYADQIRQPLPGVALVKQLLTCLQAKGRGRDGTQALLDVIRNLGSSK